MLRDVCQGMFNEEGLEGGGGGKWKRHLMDIDGDFGAKLAKVVVSHTFHRIMGLDDS